MDEKLLDVGRTTLIEHARATREYDYTLVVDGVQMGTNNDDWSAVMELFEPVEIGHSEVTPTTVLVTIGDKSVEISKAEAASIMSTITYNERYSGGR